MFDAVEKLREYVACKSVSADSAYAGDMLETREFVACTLREIGLDVELVETDGHAIVVGRREGKAEWPHVLIYGHYDVQPVDPVELWDTDPFEATVQAGRIYGRGTADNKGPQMAHLAAVGQLLEEEPDLPLRLTVLIEGEEEIGSPSLLPFLVARRRELSEADFVLLSDTLSPSEEQIAITVGLRGIIEMEFSLQGPSSDLHSGLHGGAVYNPLQAMCEICASLHDAENKVTVPGFYDGVGGVENWEREELAKLEFDEAAYCKSLDVKALHARRGYTAQEAIRYLPTLEFNGMWGGYCGEGSKTIVPSRASCKITCRLVGSQDPDRIGKAVEAAIRQRLPEAFTLETRLGHKGAPYTVVPPDRPNTSEYQSPVMARAFRAADLAIGEVFGRRPLFLREGGSIPIIEDVKRVTGLDSLMIGLFLPEDKLHAPNEGFSLSLLEKGTEVSKRILRAVASAG